MAQNADVCPSPESLRLSLDPESPMTAVERQQIEDHLERCGRCQEVIEALLRASTILTVPGVPVPSKGNDSTPDASGEKRLPVVSGFEILSELGRGGMGVVYKARQLNLGREVALKMLLRPSTKEEEQEYRRFKQEAVMLARLGHSNIVKVFNIGEADGRPYFTMELVDGESFAAKLAGNPQPPKYAAQTVKTLAEAVEIAHQQKIIHRDLKPANVLVSRDGTLKITDFGLAKLLDVKSDVSSRGLFLGTASYASPEQGEGRLHDVGPATDVYGLGAILYEVLTGRPPFKGETPLDTIRQVIDNDPVPPSRLVPRVARDLETICLKCLQKVTQKRYDSAQALSDDLNRYLADEPIRARPTTRWERTVKWVQRNPGMAGITAFSLLSLLAALAIVVMAIRQSRTEELGRNQVVQEIRRAEDVSKAYLRDGQFADAQRALQPAVEQAAHEPALSSRRDELKARSDRLRAVVKFEQLSNEGWFLAGEEDLVVEARDTIQAALHAVGVLTKDGRPAGQEWWAHLPTEDLTSEQRSELELAVYQQLILLGLARMRDGAMKITAGKEFTNNNQMMLALAKPNPEAARGFRSALEPFEQADAMERSKKIAETTTLRMLTWECHRLIDLTDTDVRKKFLLLVGEPPHVDGLSKLLENSTDCFFVGSTQFFVGMVPNDPISHMFAYEWRNLDYSTPLPKAEELLRGSTKLATRQFWPHFMLGWLLFHNGNYVAAELALDRCVELRREYPRALELRGQAIVGHALELLRGKLADPVRHPLVEVRLRRAIEDYQTALKKAPDDPMTYWSQGDLFVQLERKNAPDVLERFARALGRSPDSLDAYAQAMDLEDEVLEHPFRRNELEETRDLAISKARKDPSNADVHTGMAHAYLLLKKFDESLVAAKRALDVDPHHDRALAVRGAVYLERGLFDAALRDFNKALEKAPINYLAASGRARALEQRELNEQAREAFDYLLKPRGSSATRVARTNRHIRAAYEGLARVLTKLGRQEEAAAAEQTARQIDIAETLRRGARATTGSPMSSNR